ncbi:hypothetical protein NGTWS1803_01920 [Mycolicibacterium cyprinidarum]|nr:hypothetical protein NGTWS1803_01920 [Mycolicibacterium sp. NGTWS1803]
MAFIYRRLRYFIPSSNEAMFLGSGKKIAPARPYIKQPGMFDV